MKKAALLSGWLIIAVILIFAQEYKGQGRISGHVFDEEGTSLEGVKVKFTYARSGSSLELTTDDKGRWTANWIRGGGWNVDFEKIGYLPKKISIQVKEYAKNPEISIQMKKVEGMVITEELKAELARGNAFFEEKKYEEAAAVFMKILEKFPDAYIINKNIGNTYFQMEKYGEAESYYRKVLDIEPQNYDVMILIGNCYANRGDQDKAMEWYGRIDFERIDDPIVLYNIGTNYYNNSKFDEALKYYRKAVEIQEDFPDGLYQLGLTYLTLGSTAESIAAFETYLRLDSDSERAGQVKGFIEFLKKKFP